MIGHAEANWRVHHLPRKGTPPSKNRRKVINNFSNAMRIFKPDEVIYPHQHSRIRDEKGNLVALNAKYLLQISKKGVRLVNDIEKVNSHQDNIIATYVPLGYLAEENFINTLE